MYKNNLNETWSNKTTNIFSAILLLPESYVVVGYRASVWSSWFNHSKNSFYINIWFNFCLQYRTSSTTKKSGAPRALSDTNVLNVLRRGVVDAIKVHKCIPPLVRSSMVRMRTMQCFVLNGVIFLGSLIVFTFILKPIFMFVLRMAGNDVHIFIFTKIMSYNECFNKFTTKSISRRRFSRHHQSFLSWFLKCWIKKWKMFIARRWDGARIRRHA